jgi:hypothetical protein
MLRKKKINENLVAEQFFVGSLRDGQYLLEGVRHYLGWVSSEVAAVFFNQAFNYLKVSFADSHDFGAVDWLKDFASLIDDAAMHTCADEFSFAFFASFEVQA